MRRPVRPREWALLAVITAAAAALRLIAIGKVETDPFYDAAVRSMGFSWHNLFFGAFEPGASVSIDKPPVDLWLQVASVKLFGFTPTTLKLPEALSGIAAVPLLFLAVRRIWSTTAGLAAAAALALLPVDVITSRSDTMDGVMMLLIVLALLFAVRACESGRLGWLFAAAAVLGLAFDVKILESLVALPGLALLVLLGFPGTRRARVLKLRCRRRRLPRLRARLARRDAARSGTRPPVGDRLDQRQRLERRVRLQRQRTARRQISRTAVHAVRTRAQISRRDAV